MQPFRLLPCLAALACGVDEPSQGTAVGNPNGLSAVAGPADGITWTAGRLTAPALTLSTCADAAPALAASDLDLDLLHPAPIALPAGDWCGLALPSSTVELEGAGDAGGTVHFDLALDPLVFEAPLGEDAHIIEIGGQGWTSAEALHLDPGEALIIDGDSQWHDYIASALLDSSGLYVDGDADGQLSLPERAAGALATPATDGGDTGWWDQGWWD